MSNTLTKIASVTTLAPAIPGTPGRAPVPAYCTTQSTTTLTYPVIYVLADGSSVGAPAGTLQAIQGNSVPVTTTKTVCYPAVAGIAPTAYVPANVRTQQNLGWNAGARSVGTLAADGGALFSVPQTVIGAIVGFNNGAIDFSYADVNHALFFRRGLVSVLESGVTVGGSIPYVTTDVFRIERTGAAVRYYQNSTLLYTSTTLSYGVQYLEAALYSGNDVVLNASLVTTTTAGSGTGGAALGQLAAYGGINSSSGTAAFSPLTVSATGFMAQGGGASLAPLQALGGKAYASSVTTLLPFAAQGGADFAPAFAVGAGFLSAFSAQGMGRTGGSTVSPFNSLGDNTVAWAEQVWVGYTVFIVSGTGAGQSQLIVDNNGQALRFNTVWATPPDATSVYEIRNSAGVVLATGRVTPAGGAMLPLVALGSNFAYSGGAAAFAPISSFSAPLVAVKGYAFITGRVGVLSASAHDSTGENAADITAPAATLGVYFGAVANVTAPSGTVSASDTGVNSLRANVVAPAGILNATGTVSGTSQADVLAPMATLIGYGGAVCSVTLTGAATLQASVISGSIGSASIVAPMAKLALFQLTAKARSQADILAPAGKLLNGLQAWIVAPMATLTAIGTAVVTASFEAYSVNLSHKPRRQGEEAPVDEVTHYTNFPFTHIVRYQNSYFGVAADGLYLLEGMTDAGADIPYAVKTCIDDFKAPEKKTAAAAYFGGRLGPNAAITLHAGEQGQEFYTFTTPRGQGAQNHREKFGRGVKNRYFALSVAGSGALELDNIDLEITNLSRRI